MHNLYINRVKSYSNNGWTQCWHFGFLAGIDGVDSVLFFIVHREVSAKCGKTDVGMYVNGWLLLSYNLNLTVSGVASECWARFGRSSWIRMLSWKEKFSGNICPSQSGMEKPQKGLTRWMNRQADWVRKQWASSIHKIILLDPLLSSTRALWLLWKTQKRVACFLGLPLWMVWSTFTVKKSYPENDCSFISSLRPKRTLKKLVSLILFIYHE